MPAAAKSAVLILVALILAACASSAALQRDAVPEPLVADAKVPGYGKIRYWGDAAASFTEADINLRFEQFKAEARRDPAILNHPGRAMTISGGGSNGAFGAGVLVGLSEAGRRPSYDIVTGVSTGSLIAPFAFLGPPYDEELRRAYTTISLKNVGRQNSIFTILGGESLASNDPLRQLVHTYVSDRMLVDIAAEYAKGRRLYIGTTNLDAERPVIWDATKIAASDEPGKRQLFEDILVASAAIPGVFPPMRIKVVADGKAYDEMHVDGGTTNQVFLLPPGLSIAEIRKSQHINRGLELYILRNGKTSPEYSVVEPKLASIAGKSIGALIKTQGNGDLYRLYVQAKREGIDYNLISIPDSFTLKEKEPFDPDYMKALYAEGYKIGRSGVSWQKYPPGLVN